MSDPKDSGGQGFKDSSEMLRNFRIQGVEGSKGQVKCLKNKDHLQKSWSDPQRVPGAKDSSEMLRNLGFE